jgi:AcrR family transcriptional regulator
MKKMSGPPIINHPTNSNARERTYRGLNAEQRMHERRGRLIDAAIALYGSAGYHATSVKAVCLQAGLTERYFYESFANSEALLCACCEQLMDAQRADAQHAAERAGEELEQRLQAMAESYVQRLRECPEAARLTLFEMEGVSPEVDGFLRAQLAKTAAQIEQVVFGGPSSRPRHGLHASLLAVGLMGALYQLAKEWTRTDFERPAKEIARHLAALGVGAALRWQDRTTL